MSAREKVIEALLRVKERDYHTDHLSPLDHDDLAEALTALEQEAAAPPQPGWRPIAEGAPTEAYEFFLVCPKGIYSGDGKPFVPSVVQRIDGKLYSANNELDPLYFGENEPDDSPFKTELVWQPLPPPPIRGG